MPITIDAFLEELRAVQVDVLAALAERRAARANDGMVADLSAINQELAALEGRVRAGDLPARTRRWLGASRLVTDRWAYDDPLGHRILRLEELYQRDLPPTR